MTLIRTASKTLLAALALSAAAALAQSPVHVTVDLSKPINLLSDTAIGFSVAMYTGDNFSIAGTPYLRTTGITTPRYPGNFGLADIYHWSTKSVTPYKGMDAGYLAPESDFADFALMAEKLGNAVIVVNYGTNAAGNGPADPAEAAAWVAYANGKPNDTHPLGKDAAGNDWHTTGFWASLRADSPVMPDDGYNFLRIHHATPFGFKLWQVGGQVYNNGYFGTDHTGNPDLHGSAPNNPKDFGKLKGDSKLAPAVYAENLKTFAAAMKAVDPSILIGAALPTQVAPERSLPEFTRAVLKSSCSAIDFVSFDWQTGNPRGPDYKALDEPSLFDNTVSELGTFIRTSLDDDKLGCPKGHTPRIAFSTASPITWPVYDHPIVKALWIANTYTLLIESGFINADWPEAYSDSMMSSDHKKFGPAWYGLQMIHIVTRNPGDALMQVTPAVTGKLNVHATVRRDGNVGFMIVNTDPSSSATVKISVKGGGIGTAGKRFDYGQAEFDKSAGLTVTPITVSGSEFTVTVPAYTVTDILLPYVKQ
jgi:hypothetical protein